MIGKDLEVLFESENIQNKIKGFSSNYVRISSDFNPDIVNQFVKISVNDITDNCCTGNIIGTKNSIELIAS